PKRSGPAGPHRPPRLWTVGEANGRLDPLREQLPELRAWAMRLGKVHEEIERLRAFWGREVDAVDNPDRELRERLEAEWKRLGARLEHEVLELRSDGIEIKDLGSGLVDFYARIDGEIVFLCWQRDEDFVNHWHRLSGGYRTRQRLEGAAGADHHRVPHGI
ncbi:MAG: DUF2203 domain-containing protein, partial [Thermoplasmata archaeon]